MNVCEIFASIQGESSYAGLPCAFVRLAGCNLRCSYCDTKYSYGSGAEMPVREIIDRVNETGLHLVEITGGEPLFQKEAPLLVKGFLDEGFRVLVETNGSLSIAGLDPRAVLIMDLKTPGSGMSSSIDYSNLSLIKSSDEIKFVICGREDYEWSKAIIRTNDLEGKCTLLFSAALGMIEPSELARWIISDRLRARLNVQVHKYIFGPDETGV